RGDREVDAAGEDDEGHPDPEGEHDRLRADDVLPVPPGKEHGLGDRQVDEDHGEAEQHPRVAPEREPPERAEVAQAARWLLALDRGRHATPSTAAPPKAAWAISSSVTAPASNSVVIRPRNMTRMRSQSPSSSGSSDDTIRIPAPPAAMSWIRR